MKIRHVHASVQIRGWWEPFVTSAATTVNMSRSQWPRGLRRRSTARSPVEIVGSNPTGGMDGLSVVSVVCCQVEVSATGRSLFQRSPTDWGASLCVISTQVFFGFPVPKSKC